MSRIAHLKVAGLTHHWTYHPQKPGVPEDEVVRVRQALRAAIHQTADTPIMNDRKEDGFDLLPVHEMERFFESIEWTLNNFAYSLQLEKLSKYETLARGLMASLQKSKATLDDHKKRSYGGYKKPPEVAVRAKAAWHVLAKKTVLATQKYEGMLRSIPTTTADDVGIPEDLWAQIMKAAADIMVRVIKKGKIPLAGAMGSGKPIVNKDEITFNGKKPHNYETFSLTRMPQSAWNFCKTGNRPYDIAVTNILTAAHRIAPKVLEVNFEGPVLPLP